MADGRKSCLGFFLLAAGVGMGILAGIAVWAGYDFQRGMVVGLAVFMFLAVLAAYAFLQVRDWSWLPILVGSIYAVVPDILAGPADDIFVLLGSALLSGILVWRKQRQGKVASGK